MRVCYECALIYMALYSVQWWVLAITEISHQFPQNSDTLSDYYTTASQQCSSRISFHGQNYEFIKHSFNSVHGVQMAAPHMFRLLM